MQLHFQCKLCVPLFMMFIMHSTSQSVCLQVNEMPTCATSDCKDEFDFDIQNVVPAQAQPDASKPSVSASVIE